MSRVFDENIPATELLIRTILQKDNTGAKPRRARFHSSMMDSRMLNEGEKYTELKDSYVIFITEKDYFQKNRAIYRIERKQEEGEAFDDGSHILYVNGEYDGEEELGHLIKDFKNKGTTGFFTKNWKRAFITLRLIKMGGRSCVRQLNNTLKKEEKRE